MSPATKSLNSEGADIYAYLYQFILHMFKIDKEEGITRVENVTEEVGLQKNE